MGSELGAMIRALDLFCGAGGASMGLHRLGFDVTGVDLHAQPRYPFRFIRANALDFPLEGYDFIWASPPCQGYSRLRHLPWLKHRTWPLLIDPMRERLVASRASWVIENVEDAPLAGMVLCGVQFGLPIYRHRRFETSFSSTAPLHRKHEVVIGYGRMVNDRHKGTLNSSSAKGAWGKQQMITVAGGQFSKPDGERALGINWMSKDELAQAIPPAYSEFIARQWLESA